MWSHLTLLLIVGVAAVVGNHYHGWETDNEYRYHVQSRTMASIDKLKNQYAGILLKGDLILQTKSPNLLRAEFRNPQIGHVHTVLPHGSDTEIHDHEVNYEELPMSGKPFEIHLKHGVIRDLVVDRSVPVWEVNILKSLASQLQLDTQGENANINSDTQIPDDQHLNAIFSVMEDSVGGRCQVYYDIAPLPEDIRRTHPELVSVRLSEEEQYIDIIKTKNYSRCTQRAEYHYGIDGKTRIQPGTNQNEGLLAQLSTSRLVISGNLKQFTIQSSVTTNDIFVSPELNDNLMGSVRSKVSLTLTRKERQTTTMSSPINSVSTGNLVYMYTDLLSDTEQVGLRRPSISKNSLQTQSSESSDSSSKERRRSLVSMWGHQGRSASSSSSSEATEEQHDNVRQIQKPMLNKPAKNFILPLSIGYLGKNIQKSENFNLVNEATRLRKEMTDEIHNYKDMISSETLEKFTLLTRLIRQMDSQQINEVYSNYKEDSHSESYAQTSWEITRDAVTQAGTGPALLTIKAWIKEKILRGFEAAQVISIIPKTARLPTPEYVAEFFELIKQPELQKQPYFNSTAPFAFGEMLDNARVSETKKRNRYPVNLYGSMFPKDDETLTKTYIPYFAKQLKEALENNDSLRAQTYIMALGKIGHPQILSVFEPYLEGTYPVSKYQRLVMVASLTILADNAPHVARSVLYKIYANPEEAHEVRCAALFPLIKTNPPLVMLQRIAQYTNYDGDVHLNSAVKTIIESIAELDDPQWEELSKKARIVKNELMPIEYDYKYSQGYMKKMDNLLTVISKLYTVTLEAIGSNDHDWPKALYILNPTEDVLGQPKLEAAYAISSIKQLLKKMMRQEDNSKMLVDNVIKALDLQPEKQDPLEGILILNEMYGSQILPFDTYTFQKLYQQMQENIPNLQYNNNYLYNYDMKLSFPTETGLPFAYTLEKPMLIRVQAKTKQTNPTESVTKNSGELDVTYVSKTMSRFGFAMPIEHEQYTAGVDYNTQVTAPYAFDCETNNERYKTTLQCRIRLNSKQSEGDFRIAHYSVVPFTSRNNVLDVQPILLKKNTHIVHVLKNQERTRLNLGPATVNIQSDRKSLIKSPTLYNEVLGLLKVNDIHFKAIDLYINNDVINEWVTVNVAYNKNTYVETNSNDKEQLVKMDSLNSKLLKAEVSSQQDRTNYLMTEISKGIQSPIVYGVDINLEIPQVRSLYASIGLAESNTDENRNQQTLFFLQSLQNGIPESKYEICGFGYTGSTHETPLNYEKTIEREPKDRYFLEMLHGSTCSNGMALEIHALQTRTKEMKEAIMNSDIVRQCKQEMRQGNKAMEACQKANQLAEAKNHLSMSVQASESDLRTLANLLLKQLNPENLVESSKTEGSSKKQNIELETELSPDYQTVFVALRTPSINIELPPVDVSNVQLFKREGNNLWDRPGTKSNTCVLDKTHAITFDNRKYPVNIGNCQHVMMTVSPQQEYDRSQVTRIPQQLRTAVLVREQAYQSKQLSILLGESEIDMQRVKIGKTIEVRINGQRLTVPDDQSYRYTQNNIDVAEIFYLSDGSIELISTRYGINLVYDGERVQLQLSNDYRNSVRGLCGNYDTRADNDFITPKNCILTNPEEFTAMYALTDSNCEGAALKNKQRAQQAECTYQKDRQTNVISDKQAGRVLTENKQWGYHKDNQSPLKTRHCIQYRTKVLDDNENICFTTRPLPQCASNCKPIGKKMKQVALHCLPKNDNSQQLQRRIQQGANPDLSQRKVSKTHNLELPLGCTAA